MTWQQAGLRAGAGATHAGRRARGRRAEPCRDLSVGGRTVRPRGGSCWSWLLPEGTWKGFLLCWRVKGSSGSSEKRSGLARSWFGLNAANATLRWSGTAVYITSLVLQTIRPICTSLWFFAIEAEEGWGHCERCAGSTAACGTWHYPPCVTRGELAQGLGWDAGAGRVCGPGWCLGDI